MTSLQLAVLALVQGVTEFLPVSSSGHLVLSSKVLGWPDQGLEIDIAVHAGTLLAVAVYFRRDVARILAGLAGRGAADSRALAGMLALASVPVCAVGFALHEAGVHSLREPAVVAWATLGFGVLLFIADRTSATPRRMEDMTWSAAAAIGLAQTLALIPGASRAGVTITAARFMGFERQDAARFSMLLSIPAIAGATALASAGLHENGNAELTRAALVAGTMAFAAAMVCIRLMMAWLRRASYTPFVVYRVALGAGLLAWVYL